MQALTRALVSGALSLLAVASVRAEDEALRWNRVASEATAAAGTDPLTESRIFAIMHIAVHDALNAVEPRYETYGDPVPAAPGAAPEAAVAAAAHDTLAELLPTGRAAFAAALRQRVDAARGDRDTGAEAGRRAARRILDARRGDGCETPARYDPGRVPGAYRPTPPDFTPAALPQWGKVKPFALRSSSQFRPGPPPKVTSAQALADVEEVRRIGAKEGSGRTAEHDEIARYWYENSPQGWNRIAREVAAARALDLWESARLMALVNVAMADGFIAGFESKYHYAYWRPATAIREAGEADWLSYLDTPPVPDYPSTHTVLGAAAAAVLARFFGTDFVPFSMTSGAPYPGLTRRFWSFSEAARENGASRVLAGIHFATAVGAGYEQGDQVGAWTFDHVFRPKAAARAGR